MSHKMKPWTMALAALMGLVFLWYSPENTRCNLQNLILKDERMPSGWQRTWYILPPALPNEGAQDALGVQFDQDNKSFAHHTLYRYRNWTEAFLWVRINRELFFPSSWHWSSLEMRAERRLAADEARIECGDSKDDLLGHLCIAIMRYGPFVSDFSSAIGPEHMTMEEFHDIVVAIDQDFSACLK